LRLTPLAVNLAGGFFFARLSCPRRRAPPCRTRARDGLPPTHEGVASDSVRARGRPTPHTKILSCQSSVLSPQHIIWPQGRDYKNSQLITHNSLLITSHTFLLKRILALIRLRSPQVARMTFLGLHSPVPSP